MKKFYFSLIATLLLLTNLSYAQCTGTCTSTINTGSNADMNFTSGTYCFTGGEFTGNVSGLSAGVTICIGPNAGFKPANVNGTLNGTIKVYGQCILPTLNTGNGFTLENYNSTTFSGNLNFNGSNASIYNYNPGYMIFQRSFQLQNAATIENYGVVLFNADFNTDFGTTFTNKKTVRINGNFSPAGTVVNDGLLVAQNAIDISSSASLLNNCQFISVKGFTNNGYITNNGFIWVTSSNENESYIQNKAGATIEGGVRSIVRGIQFTNNGTVKGYGKYYFTGTTRQQGIFTGSSAAAKISFYDTTPSVNQMFDFPQQNQQYTNTSRIYFTPDDTTTFNCSGNTSILPVQLTGFDAKAQQHKSVLLSWQTQTETNVYRFAVERTDKAIGGLWKAIGNVAAFGNSNTLHNYQFNDKTPLSGTSYYRLRMIDVDNTETMSVIRRVSLADEVADMLVYPTIAQKGSIVKFSTTELVRYQMVNMEGKILSTGTFNSGISLLTINMEAGVYIIETINANKVRRYTKMIVQ